MSFGKSRKDVAGTTGVLRHVDDLGRIVLPITLRRRLDINEKDDLEIYVESDAVILKKYHPSCCFCDATNNLSLIKGKRICNNCLEKIKNL